jgi:hypothetical protein
MEDGAGEAVADEAHTEGGASQASYFRNAVA